MFIGDRLKKAREKRKLTMQELADAAGLTQSTVSRIERDQTEPERKTIIALAQALDDNLGVSWVSEHLNKSKPAVSKKEIVDNMTAREFVSLKFGGRNTRRSKEEAEMLARLLDAEIERMKRDD
jgi:transcriptional regulator with XRE-family HTH domain